MDSTFKKLQLLSQQLRKRAAQYQQTSTWWQQPVWELAVRTQSGKTNGLFMVGQVEVTVAKHNSNLSPLL